MVSNYDCEKQHNFRQFNSLSVKECSEVPSYIQHANVNARTYVHAKAERVKAFLCKERTIDMFPRFRSKYKRFDRSVWNHNTMQLPVTLGPLKYKNLLRHLNGSNNNI